MPTEEEARRWFASVLRDGSKEQRDAFFSAIKPMELGVLGDAAKRLSEERDDKFILGVDFGIMIGLNFVYKFMDE